MKFLNTLVCLFLCFFFPSPNTICQEVTFFSYRPAPSPLITIQIKILLKQATKIYPTDSVSADSLTQKALQLSRENSYPEGIMKVYGFYAQLYANSNADSAIHYQKKVISISERISNISLLLNQYAGLIKLYTTYNYYNEAINTYHHIVPLLSPYRDNIPKVLLSNIQNNVGRAYYLSSNYDSALYHYTNSLKVTTPVDKSNYQETVMAHTGKAIAYGKSNNHRDASEHFKQALHIATTFKDTIQIIMQLSNLGVTYFVNMQMVQEGLHYLYQALNLSTGKYRQSTPQIYGMLAQNLLESYPDSLNRALQLTDSSYHHALESNNIYNIIQSNYVRGYVYVKANKLAHAEKYLLAAFMLAQEKKLWENMPNACFLLSDIYQQRKQPYKAIQYLKLGYAYRDSIYNAEKAKHIAHIEQQYKAAEKDQQLALQKVSLQNQKAQIKNREQWLAAVGSCGSLSIILILVLYRNSRIKQKHLQSQQEINLLKTRIEAEQNERNRIGQELHDGIVSQLLAVRLHINSIQSSNNGKINQYALQQATHQLEEATTDLRSTTHSLVPEALVQQGLTNAIATLCNKIGRTGKIEVDFQVFGVLSPLSGTATLYIYRIIQELMNNTLKHAKATQVIIQFSYRDGSIYITFEDNGIGFSAGHSTGIGIKTVKNRVNELRGSIDITSTANKGTIIYLEFEEKWLIE